MLASFLCWYLECFVYSSAGLAKPRASFDPVCQMTAPEIVRVHSGITVIGSSCTCQTAVPTRLIRKKPFIIQSNYDLQDASSVLDCRQGQGHEHKFPYHTTNDQWLALR